MQTKHKAQGLFKSCNARRTTSSPSAKVGTDEVAIFNPYVVDLPHEKTANRSELRVTGVC